MGNSILGISLSGLHAAQAGLTTTSHNIANANTPGYSRQVLVQNSRAPQLAGSGFLGQGVDVAGIERIYSSFLSGQLNSAQSAQAELDVYHSQMRQLDNMLADTKTGLNGALQAFFSGVNDVANRPNDTATRQVAFNQAESLAARFQSLDARIASVREGANEQINASIQAVNTYASQIAKLNDQIAQLESNTKGQQVNDLRDQRDHLLYQLSEEVRVTMVEQSDGSYNVFIGNGQALVVGAKAGRLGALTSPTDPQKLDLAFSAGGQFIRFKPDSLQGGRLAGLMSFQSAGLDAAKNELGRIALNLAGTFNAQHRLGQDLNGALGSDFFKVPVPQVNQSTTNTGNASLAASITDFTQLAASDYRVQYDGSNYVITRLSDSSVINAASLPQTIDGVQLSLASGAMAAGDEFLVRPTFNAATQFALALTNSAQIAAAAPVRGAIATANTGDGTINVAASDASNANLLSNVTITFTSASTFDVSGAGTGNPTGLSYTSGGNISFNGWTAQISNSPAAGDSFTIGANPGAVSDNRNALALAGLQSQKLLEGGTASYEGGYAKLVSYVGSRTRELEISSQAQAGVVKQTRDAQQSFSGVNLEEEAANLIRYQAAYQAAAKAMEIARTLFSQLLEL
jgi:flagellar hook-associated protein 1 FlgK